MNYQYIPIFLLIIFAVIFACLPLIFSFIINYLINKKNPKNNITKLSKKAQTEPYECGNLITTVIKVNIPIKFALTAILFIIFDLGVILLFPWALIKLTLEAKIGLIIFLFNLIIGFIYQWKQGALKW